MAKKRKQSGLSRRQFLFGAAGATAGAAAYHYTIWERIMFWLGIKEEMPFKFVVHNAQPAIEVYVHKGMGYILLAELYTGSGKNAKEIEAFNDEEKPRAEGSVFIQYSLLAPYVLDIINKKIEVQTFIIDNDKVTSLGKFAELYLDANVYGSFLYNIYMIEILNPQINPKNDIVVPGQEIFVPLHLLKEDVEFETDADDEDEEIITHITKPDREPTNPLPEIQTKLESMSDRELLVYYAKYYPPIKKRREDIVAGIRQRDKFGAPRIRSGGRVSKHTGLDIVAPVGTSLYPMAIGKVTVAGKEPKGALWRNGNVVEIQTERGWRIKYCHLAEVYVKKGDIVGFGTVVGTVGVTGNASSNNPHVHVSTRLFENLRNPTILLEKDANFLHVVQGNQSKYLTHFKKVRAIDKKRP